MTRAYISDQGDQRVILRTPYNPRFTAELQEIIPRRSRERPLHVDEARADIEHILDSFEIPDGRYGDERTKRQILAEWEALRRSERRKARRR
jgi:hypothetical protein